MTRVLLGLLLFLSSMLGSRAVDEPLVWVGMSREQVIEVLGWPESLASTDKRTIFLYKDGSRFEFESGNLVSLQGFKGRIEFSDPSKPLDAPVAPLAMDATAARGQQDKTAQTAKPAPQPTKVRTPVSRPFSQKLSQSPYKEITEPAVNSFLRLTVFFGLVYDPEFLDSNGDWHPPAMLVLACLLRAVLTMLAFRFAGRRCERELLWHEYLLFSCYDLGLRLGLSAIESYFFAGLLPALASEAIVAALLFLIIWRRIDKPGWWMSLRLVLIAKLAVGICSFAMFMLLLNLSVG